jgi:Meiotically up-regulated gene 113
MQSDNTPSEFGYVYFIRAEDETRSWPIKIGWSMNPNDRIFSLKTGNHCKLRLIFYAPGPPALEETLHKKFSRYRLEGEWFAWNDELVNFILEWKRTGKLPANWYVRGKLDPAKKKKWVAPMFEINPNSGRLCYVCKCREVYENDRCWKCRYASIRQKKRAEHDRKVAVANAKAFSRPKRKRRKPKFNYL